MEKNLLHYVLYYIRHRHNSAGVTQSTCKVVSHGFAETRYEQTGSHFQRANTGNMSMMSTRERIVFFIHTHLCPGNGAQSIF